VNHLLRAILRGFHAFGHANTKASLTTSSTKSVNSIKVPFSISSIIATQLTFHSDLSLNAFIVNLSSIFFSFDLVNSSFKFSYFLSIISTTFLTIEGIRLTISNQFF
jgi:hypothetical protein